MRLCLEHTVSIYQAMKGHLRSWAVLSTSFHTFACVSLWRHSVGVLEQRRNKLSFIRQNKFTFHRINHKNSSSDPSYHLNYKITEKELKVLAVPALQFWGTSSRPAEFLLPVPCQRDKNTGLYLRQGWQWITPTLLLGSESRKTGTAREEMCMWRLLMENTAWVH